ncbi:MAG: hypothetical protein QNK37_32195 [Acidobacteriota bacterium]|nr:hypothetical protein [Acidobacteriota bacterium]
MQVPPAPIGVLWLPEEDNRLGYAYGLHPDLPKRPVTWPEAGRGVIRKQSFRDITGWENTARFDIFEGNHPESAPGGTVVKMAYYYHFLSVVYVDRLNFGPLPDGIAKKFTTFPRTFEGLTDALPI